LSLPSVSPGAFAITRMTPRCTSRFKTWNAFWLLSAISYQPLSCYYYYFTALHTHRQKCTTHADILRTLTPACRPTTFNHSFHTKKHTQLRSTALHLSRSDGAFPSIEMSRVILWQGDDTTPLITIMLSDTAPYLKHTIIVLATLTDYIYRLLTIRFWAQVSSFSYTAVRNSPVVLTVVVRDEGLASDSTSESASEWPTQH